MAVAFEDIFCSAKLDCVPELLSRPGPDGARDLTAVLAFACTSGAADTCLYANTVTLDCGPSGSWTVNPSLGPGNLEVLSPLLYRAAIYRGEEAFVAFKKSYWNVALGLDEDAFSANPDCTLRWQATASGGPLGGLGPYTTPPGTYPVVTWERDILVGGALNCGAHPINVTLSGEDTPSVATDYTAIGTPALFSFSDCGDGGPEPIIGQCGLADGLSFESAPTDDLCASGQASAVSGTGPFTWSCSGQFGGDNDTCSADRSCDAATLAWSVGGAECEGGVDAAEHDVEQTAFDAATPSTGSRDYRCEQGVWVGLGDGTCVASGTETFEYTGSVVTFVVPSGVSSIEVEAFGAQGGEVLSAPGGRGAGVTATVPVVGGETLQIRVGGQGGGGSGVTAIAGYNGGGGSSRGLVGTNNSGAGGGGATEIRRSPFGLADRLLVAGGGGGAGGHSLSGQTIAERTGANAGQVGLDGAVRSCASGRPGGATQTAGGAGATASCPWANSGSGGSFGTGGSGAGTNSSQGSVGGGTQGTSGGGGGGGWYGGGGAAGNGIGNGGSAGGGGGSSYAVPGSSGVTFTTGARTGHGQLILTY